MIDWTTRKYMKKTILLTTLIAGSLDILAAFIQSYVLRDVMPTTVLKYIASGIFGSNAYSGGIDMIAMGLLIHYTIAFSCTACFFWLYPKWHFLKKSIIVNSILIALIAWIVPTQIAVPLSKIEQGTVDIYNAFKAMVILTICIGLPISYRAKHYFNN